MTNITINKFLLIWAVSSAEIAACRILPALVLRGRPLSYRITEALGYIPPAAFAALIANDLYSAQASEIGLWANVMPLIASMVVLLVAKKTRSMIWCCVAGVASYVVLSLI